MPGILAKFDHSVDGLPDFTTVCTRKQDLEMRIWRVLLRLSTDLQEPGEVKAIDATGLDRIEENARFHIDSLTTDALASGKALFRQHEPLSFVDACLVAYMQTGGLDYQYAFDDDFDAVEDVYRLDTAPNPCDPN